MGSLEPVICRKIDNDSGIPGPIEDGCDSAVEGAADETAGVQIPLVLYLLEYRSEQILWESFAHLRCYFHSVLRAANDRKTFPGGPSGVWIA